MKISVPHVILSTALYGAMAFPIGAQEGADGEIDLEDPVVADETLAFSDVTRFKFWSTGKDLHGEVELAKSLQEGMFTCVHLKLDCDLNLETGIQGAEIWYRGAIGSRFHPNSFAAAEGDPKPLELRRASYSLPTQSRMADGTSRSEWLHRSSSLPKPVVEGNRISFRLPVSIIKQRSSRYNSVARIQASVETSCSDQPLMLDWSCQDEGVTVRVDGDAAEWSGVVFATDPGDELHVAARAADLTELRVEHSNNRLFALLHAAVPGFADEEPTDPDIIRRDSVTVYVDPRHPRYQKPVKARMSWGRSDQERSGYSDDERWISTITGNTFELEFHRATGQNRFRVLAWSDVVRFDEMSEGEFVPMDWSKKR